MSAPGMSLAGGPGTISNRWSSDCRQAMTCEAPWHGWLDQRVITPRYSPKDRIRWNDWDPRLYLRNEDNPASIVFPCPGFFDLGQRDRIYVNREVHLGYGGKHFGERLQDLFCGEAAQTAADELNPRAAEQLGRQGDRVPADRSNLHETYSRFALRRSMSGRGLQDQFRRWSPQVVQNNLHPCQPRAETPQQILFRLAQRDGLVRAQNTQLGEDLFIATGSNDPRRAQVFCHLNRLFSCDSGCSVDQNSLTRLEICPAEKRAPGREAGISQGCPDRIVNIRAERNRHGSRNHTQFSHGAERRTERKEVDAGTVRIHADTIVPGREGKFRDTAVVGSIGLTAYQIAQRGSTNLKDHFAVIGNRRRCLPIAWWKTEFFYQGGAHVISPGTLSIIIESEHLRSKGGRIYNKPMSTSRIMTGGWVNRKTMPRGQNGRGLCRWCTLEVPARRFTFCSEYCVHEWKLRSQPGYLREHIFKRDRGVCAHCAADTIREHSKLKRSRGSAREALMRHWGLKTRVRKSLWDADHILPVAEGGGECDLDNIRTLCLRCHRSVTMQLRERIRSAKVVAMLDAEPKHTAR